VIPFSDASHTTAGGGVAYWAHVGGFATGLALIWLFRKPERVGKMQAHHAGPWSSG